MPSARGGNLKSCANPKYASWIQEKWSELAEGSNLRFTYGKALKAIVAYPEYLPTPQAAVDKVKGIGPNIKEFLESKIREENGGISLDSDTGGARTPSPKKRSRPKNSKTTSESRPAKRAAASTGALEQRNPLPPIQGTSTSLPTQLTYLFWYLDASNRRVATKDEGIIEFFIDQAGHKIEIAPECDPLFQQRLLNVRRVGDKMMALLPLDDADNSRFRVSTMPLETLATSSRASSVSKKPSLLELLNNDAESQRSKLPTLDPSRQGSNFPGLGRRPSTQSIASIASTINLEDNLPEIRSLSRPSSSLARTHSLPVTNSNAVAGPSFPHRSAPLDRTQTTGSMGLQSQPNASTGLKVSQRSAPLGRSQTTESMGPPLAPLRLSQAQNNVPKLTGRPRLSEAIPNLPTADVSFDLDSYAGFESTTFDDFVPVTLPRNTYDILLILDNREKDYASVASKLRSRGIPVEMRSLALGDVTWTAKRRNRTGDTRGLYDEISLDAILERKRLDDLCSSIKDGRFHEQKFRLHQSGITHVFYLVEDYTTERERFRNGSEPQIIATALSSTQVVDGFMVRETKKLSDTVDLYASFHRADQDLHVIPVDRIKRYNYLAFQRYFRKIHQERSYLITYESFDHLNSKSGFTTVQTSFAKMLLSIDGMSAEKVGWMIKMFPKPKDLYEYFIKQEQEEAKMREQEMINPPTPVGRQRKARSQVVEAKHSLQDIGVGIRKIGPSLSEKVYNQFRAISYADDSD